jgi:hypothetical protein
MTQEQKQPFDEEIDGTVDWEILIKEDGLYIHWPAKNRLQNLGQPEAVFTKMAEAMAKADFGER